MSSPKLSKSRYLSGLQCHLKLWYDCYERELAAPNSAAQQAIFDAGNEVGLLATKRHPNGVMIEADYLHHEEAIASTRRAMDAADVPALFEAAFLHEDVRTRADILVRRDQGAWDLVEVKSSLSVKDINLDDLAVQKWVLRGAGLNVGTAGILTLNRDYVYAGGEHDVGTLFAFHDLTAQANAKFPEVAGNVAAMHAMLRRGTPPAVSPGEQCHSPYECPYYEHCTRGLEFPEYPVLELPNLQGKRKGALLSLGLEKVEDIPAGFDLSPLQERVRDCVIGGRPFVSSGLGQALTAPAHPIHHLDFETFMLPVPRYVGTRPYQTLPFQWSNHIERRDGSVVHEEYLCREDKDPRREFAETLLASLDADGTICVYTAYELRVIRELAEALPELHGALLALLGRVWDLKAVVAKHYYHPAFHGSFSLKRVLPALVPEMSYEGLAIQDGTAASRAYIEAILTNDARRREELQVSLLQYCGQDTLAMVALRERLARSARGG